MKDKLSEKICSLVKSKEKFKKIAKELNIPPLTFDIILKEIQDSLSDTYLNRIKDFVGDDYELVKVIVKKKDVNSVYELNKSFLTQFEDKISEINGDAKIIQTPIKNVEKNNKVEDPQKKKRGRKSKDTIQIKEQENNDNIDEKLLQDIFVDL